MPNARQKATNTYRNKALANIALVISHTEPEVLDALNKIIAHKDCSKAMAIKTALVEYANTLD
ncbi:hypothetical protein SAMN02745664_1235 [Moraxella cuniculi DSM 21768]|uniref:Uncharacterized protein n=1 Tax=Moraxella cuniculi DSM 21768 TaxID=1122245 RepID=A0A1N7G3X1_9GAMM|nr:hypothetical protein [Moraxella cuniculi]OOS03279.1 hypothetical protein B0189_09765 [Moraxella cuniculi]SIS07255.1 hypothetical protein SAMN02745664_1235 [Moraxella cuniculi DSM 21768]